MENLGWDPAPNEERLCCLLKDKKKCLVKQVVKKEKVHEKKGPGCELATRAVSSTPFQKSYTKNPGMVPRRS